MRLTFCGVRGSTPAPGAPFVRTGGHTSCVAVSHDGEAPSVVLDAGTGIRNVTALLDGAPFQGSVLLGHLHWDHTQGLPFFAGGDNPGSRVDLYMPAQGDAAEVLTRFMSPPHFPITPRDLRGTWRILGLEPGEHTLEGFTVEAADITHSPGRTFGLRVSDGHSSVAYLSDHSPPMGFRNGRGPAHEDSALRLARGCDVLIHDAQHLDEEFEAKAFMGHSPIGYALALAEAAGAKRLLLFHHDPSRVDDEVDALVASMKSAPVPVSAAVEGMVIDL